LILTRHAGRDDFDASRKIAIFPKPGDASRLTMGTRTATGELLMIDHISIGVRDISRAKQFYDVTLNALGYTCLSEADDSLGYGRDTVAFWVSAVDSPVPPDTGSGLHLCFTAPTRKDVDTFHMAALGAGGYDNGKPGLRTNYGAHYYADYVIDPDGYRIEALCG
jgi:catechol 2,3-dioxygenase-like lactoylglutathione lyase family enzyme